MSSASAVEPGTDELHPVTRSDLDTALRMVRRCGVHDEADDVAQEVVIGFSRYSRPLVLLGHLAPAEARRIVLWGFVRRVVANHIRERAGRRARGGEPVRAQERDEAAQTLERLCGAAPSAEERVLEQARHTLLHAAVDEIGAGAPDLYAVLRGHLDGLPMSRVAATLRMPEDTAWSRWRHGCEAVRALLGRWAADEARGAVRMWFDFEKRARATSTRPAAKERKR